jgi:hypothetical protein
MPQNGIDTEFTNFHDNYVSYGFNVPPDTTRGAMLIAVGKVYTPTELPPISRNDEISDASKRYFEREVQSALQKALYMKQPKALELGQSLGRFAAAASEIGFVNLQEPLQVHDNRIVVDGKNISYAPQYGRIVDYGMGMNGLKAHLLNLQRGKYIVNAFLKDRAEVAVLTGFAEYFGISSNQLQLSAGINAGIDALVAKGDSERIDLIVASRVHMASLALKYGISRSSTLLGEAGILIARGPRKFKDGFTYDQVARAIGSDKNLQIEVDDQYDSPTPVGTVETNRLIVARKK